MQVDRFNADPLVSRSKMTVETAHALLTASDTIIANIEKINWPFLCIHGDADKLCDCKGARLLLERSSSSDKTVTVGRLLNLGDEFLHKVKVVKFSRSRSILDPTTEYKMNQMEREQNALQKS